MVTDISANITFKVPFFEGRKILIIFKCLDFIRTIDIFSSSTSGTGVTIVTRGSLDKICKLISYPPESHFCYMDVRGFNFVP